MEKVQAARLPEVSILRRLPEGSRDFYSSIDHKFPCRFLVAHCRREGLFRFDPITGFYIIENLRGRCHSCHTKKTQCEMGQDWTAEIDALLSKYRKHVG